MFWVPVSITFDEIILPVEPFGWLILYRKKDII